MNLIKTQRERALFQHGDFSTVAVLGAGAWGTALAVAFARQGANVRLWTWRSAHADAMAADGENREHLADCVFPAGIEVTSDMAGAVSDAQLVLFAAPSGATETLAKAAAAHASQKASAIICAKGLAEGGDLLSASVRRVWQGPVLTLSGPSFADEVGADLPTIVALAGPAPHAQRIAAAFSRERFVLCPTGDSVGVQICAVFKNVAATLCGAADGLDLGANARAALMSEAMREAGDLVAALGGRRETLLGPAGFGDFALTCTDAKSRNYSYGRMIAQGGPDGSIAVTREGAANVGALLKLARRAGVYAPLAMAVDDLLAGRLSAQAAVEAAFAGRRDRVAEAVRAA